MCTRACAGRREEHAPRQAACVYRRDSLSSLHRGDVDASVKKVSTDDAHVT
jgi:hypothetical protein